MPGLGYVQPRTNVSMYMRPEEQSWSNWSESGDYTRSSRDGKSSRKVYNGEAATAIARRPDKRCATTRRGVRRKRRLPAAIKCLRRMVRTARAVLSPPIARASKVASVIAATAIPARTSWVRRSECRAPMAQAFKGRLAHLLRMRQCKQCY